MAHEDDEDDLNEKLKAAGIDLAFVQDVSQLTELKKLVKAGKVKPEIYRQFERNLFRKKQQRDANAAKNKNFMIRVFKKGKFRADTAAENPKFAPLSTPRQSKKHANSTSGNTDQSANTLGKKIIEDELFRLGNNRLGKAKWRRVFVILFEKAIEYYRRNPAEFSDEKPIRRIVLESDFFVSEVRNGILKRTDINNVANNTKDDEERSEGRLSISTEKSSVDDVMEQPHLFLVSNLKEKYYFAAEDEEKKQYWVMMLTTIIRDLLAKESSTNSTGNSNTDFASSAKSDIIIRPTVETRTPEQIAADLKSRQEAYVRSKMRQTLHLQKLKSKSLNPGGTMSEIDIANEEQKWKRQGEKVARQSIALDMLSMERERAQYDVKEQEELKREIRDKDRALKQLQQKLVHTEELLDQFRKDAEQRHKAKLGEHDAIRNSIYKLKRQSVMPGRDLNRDYEQEIEMYKTKLKALEAALKVDLEGLDWNGTLEDAEEKMKELMPSLLASDPKVQQEAQTKFDQWDNIVRNHKDFIARERDKWKNWEADNFEKNLDALNEMRGICPEIMMHGATEEQIMQKAGIPQKTANRVMKNNIFKFFWMDKDTIAKIHIADLLNRYASQGLDIRELRAIYAALPEEFQNDNTGQKRQFREQIRNRLFELTNKEATGTLSSQEKLNNAYRSVEVKEKYKVAVAPSGENDGEKPKVKINRNMQAKALALQAMLEKKGNVPAKPAVTTNSNKNEALDVNDAKYAKYFRMKKAGLPEGAILNAFQKDNLDPQIWFKLQDLKEKGTPTTATQNTTASDNTTISAKTVQNTAASNSTQTSSQVNNEDLKQAANKFLKNAKQQPETFGVGNQMMNMQPLKKKKTRSKRNTRGSNLSESGSESGSLVNENNGSKSVGETQVEQSMKKSKAKKNKKTLRLKKQSQPESHLLMADSNALLQKVQLGENADQYKRGSHGFNTLTYGSNTKNIVETVQPESMSKSEKRAANMKNSIEDSLQELVDIIMAEGSVDSAEGGLKTMKFGDLFLKYEKISDMLVGLLLKGKRGGRLKYRGDMLFKGIHDDIKITVVKP